MAFVAHILVLTKFISMQFTKKIQSGSIDFMVYYPIAILISNMHSPLTLHHAHICHMN